MTEEQIIEDILDEFDFDRVHKVMEFLDWGWTDGSRPLEVPTIGQLRKRARTLLRSLIGKEDNGTATGGFWVTKKTFDGEPFYRLQFVLSSWDNYE
jgi:hypothetical protein